MGERRVLSSLELLPAEAEEDRLWALAQLNEFKRTQQDILVEFNTRLADKGIGPISRSAFSRTSMRLAKRARLLAERTAVYAGIAPKLKPEVIGESDIVLGEFLKTLIDELMDSEGGLDTKNALELAKAYKEIIVGQRHSLEMRARAEKISAEKLAQAEKEANEKLGAIVGHVANELGISSERAADLRRKLLGVRAPAQVLPPDAHSVPSVPLVPPVRQ